ncbi:Protein of uncharacterised function (DUF1407) [Kluyvera cryocrescens]|uniref:Protein of uncharacterized function (DUF1407) n=1 Tax=Kluyvera cryocrescens TaxID=580 RepID=A0A485AV01_KLUCR|nr:Protein of uncharacterised function (DUF1407) [Kluyvera cryocrescens]
MEFICPICQASLEVQGNHAHCQRCEKEYTLEARCPECHQPLGSVKSLWSRRFSVPARARTGLEKAGGVGASRRITIKANRAGCPVMLADQAVFLRVRVFFSAVTVLISLSTQPSASRVVSRSPAFACFVCFSTLPSLAVVTL